MQTFERICIRDAEFKDSVGNCLKLKKDKKYLTSKEENGMVMVFGRFWGSVPIDLFDNENKIEFTEESKSQKICKNCICWKFVLLDSGNYCIITDSTIKRNTRVGMCGNIHFKYDRPHYYNSEDSPKETLFYFDAESCKAYFYTDELFGCIHYSPRKRS